jgi:hypothetical protein
MAAAAAATAIRSDLLVIIKWNTSNFFFDLFIICTFCDSVILFSFLVISGAMHEILMYCSFRVRWSAGLLISGCVRSAFFFFFFFLLLNRM